jgi:nicotinamidase-related amidase
MTQLTNPALVVIDAQVGINEEMHWGGNRNNPDAEKNIALLLEQWRRMKFPVVIVQHNSVSSASPFRPHYSGNKLMDFVNRQQDEKLIQKSTACAFIKTDLQQYIEQQKITALFITGFVTNNSVESTARHAGDLGIETVVVSDATACFDKLGMNGSKFTSDVVHALSLANLKDEYAAILTTKEVLYLLNRQSTIQNLRSV